MKKLIFTFFIVAVVISGCKKQFVGEYFNMSSSWVCRTSSFPAECRINYFSELVPEFTITKLNNDGLYQVEGSLDPTQGSMRTFDHIVPAQSTFKLLFINNSRVFDSKIINTLDTDLGRKLHFKMKYNSKGVDIEAVSYTYRVSIEG